MNQQVTAPAPVFNGAPEWLTLPFVLIAAGVLVALVILFWGARLASRRRNAREELEDRGEVHYEDELPPARPITPPPPVAPAPPPVAETPPLPVPPVVDPLPDLQTEPTIAGAFVDGEAAIDALRQDAQGSSQDAAQAQADLRALAEDAATPPPPPPPPPPPVPEAEAPEPAEPILADEPIAAAAPFDASPASIAASEPAPAEPEPEAEPVPAPAPAPSAADDLTRMKGVGPRLADRLNSVGVTSFAQIAALTPEDAEALDAKLGDFQGRIHRDRWIDQARFLANNDIAGFEETFGKL